MTLLFTPVEYEVKSLTPARPLGLPLTYVTHLTAALLLAIHLLFLTARSIWPVRNIHGPALSTNVRNQTPHLSQLYCSHASCSWLAQAGTALSLTPFVIFFKEQGNDNRRHENEKQQDSFLWYKHHSVANDFHQSRSVQTRAAECL